MKTEVQSSQRNYLIAAILGVLAVLLMVLFLGGVQLPVITTDRAIFITLAILGIAMCSLGGIGPAVREKGWSNPFTILGSVLGALALLLIAGVLLGIQLPLIDSDRAAILALAFIGLVKVLLNGLQRFTAPG